MTHDGARDRSQDGARRGIADLAASLAASIGTARRRTAAPIPQKGEIRLVAKNLERAMKRMNAASPSTVATFATKASEIGQIRHEIERKGAQRARRLRRAIAIAELRLFLRRYWLHIAILAMTIALGVTAFLLREWIAASIAAIGENIKTAITPDSGAPSSAATPPGPTEQVP